MVRKGNTEKANNTNFTTARRAPATAAAAQAGPVQAGPVQALKDRAEGVTVSLFDTYPLQSEADAFTGGAVVDDNSDALSDVSTITNPGDYGELPDCMIIDPPETLQEELFDPQLNHTC